MSDRDELCTGGRKSAIEEAGVAAEVLVRRARRRPVGLEDGGRKEAARPVSPPMSAAPCQETFKIFKDPMGVAVIGSTLPGARGTWRRISLDLQTFGFVVSFADLIRQKSYNDETKS